jgi:hypothetical protein
LLQKKTKRVKIAKKTTPELTKEETLSTAEEFEVDSSIEKQIVDPNLLFKFNLLQVLETRVQTKPKPTKPKKPKELKKVKEPSIDVSLF